jgi:beta-mannosidase
MKRTSESSEVGEPGMSRRAFIGSVGAAGMGVAGINVVSAETSLSGALAGREAPDQGVTAIPAPSGNASRISLDGKWKLFYFPQGKYPITGPDQLKTSGLAPIEALIPGEAALDLSRKGELPADLYFGENILKLRPYELYEWWYQREFPTPGSAAGERLELRFRGVDCLATYWLNGKKLGETANALIEHQFDVTGKLNPYGPNVLTVRLRSPVLEAADKQYDPGWDAAQPTNMEQIWIRKAPHSFGWNIMPRAVTAGLWRPVELIVHPRHEIKDMYFATVSLSSRHARLTVCFQITTDPALLPHLRLRIQGHSGDSTFIHVHNLEFTAGRIDIRIASPKLWWPRGYGQPDLYEVTTELLQDDTVLASRRDSVGIRKLELISHDAQSPEEPALFLFKVNDVPILCKGTNWVPLDVFHSRDAARVQKVMDLAVDLECNFIRCWAGNVYEDHEFFDLCDRHGIMVWQDFALANALYPQTREFLEVIKEEAISVIRKLRNHPSLAMWCGGNEYDQLCYVLHLDPANDRITREILPQAIFQCDPYRPYHPGCPYYSPKVIATRDTTQMPEKHVWGPRDYFKGRNYTEHMPSFVSEAGYDGCPGLSSLKRFLDEKHLWPWQDNTWWQLHSSSMTLRPLDPVENHTLANEAQELFGALPDNLEDFVLATQFTEAEAVKFFLESTRLNKWRRTGMIWWNLMDGWAQMNDSVVDYYFNKKLAYYYIRRVQKPVCAMVDEPTAWYSRVVIGNDSREDSSGHYRVWDADSGKTLLEGDYQSKANENLEVGRIPVFHSDHRLFLIEWTARAQKYVNHYMLGMPPFSLDQYKSWLPKIAALQNDFAAAKVGK